MIRYFKVLHCSNGVTYTKQRAGSLIQENDYGDVLLKFKNHETNQDELRWFKKDEVSRTPYFMEFE